MENYSTAENNTGACSNSGGADTELKRIETAIDHLSSEMYRYHDEMKFIWDEKIGSFISSGDCTTMQNISDRDFKKFMNFMSGSKVYKIMQISRKRLVRRRQYIIDMHLINQMSMNQSSISTQGLIPLDKIIEAKESKDSAPVEKDHNPESIESQSIDQSSDWNQMC